MNRYVTLTFGRAPYSTAAMRRVLLSGVPLAPVCLALCLAVACRVSGQSIAAPSGGHASQPRGRLYSHSSFWNTPIAANATADPASAVMVTRAIAPDASTSVFANGESWGVAVVISDSGDKEYPVRCLRYCTERSVGFPIPLGTRPSAGSDHHLAVLDNTRELDLWDASFDPAKDAWSAATVVVNDAAGSGASCPIGTHCNGAVAAGFALLGGLVWPQEIRSGHIEHALALTLPRTRAGVIACPATHSDGKFADPAAIPEGARLQLDPAFNVEAQPWPAWEKILARALQKYGAYVVDTGGRLAIRGVTDINLGDNSWASAATPTQAGLSELPWDRVRVLQFRLCN